MEEWNIGTTELPEMKCFELCQHGRAIGIQEGSSKFLSQGRQIALSSMGGGTLIKWDSPIGIQEGSSPLTL